MLGRCLWLPSAGHEEHEDDERVTGQELGSLREQLVRLLRLLLDHFPRAQVTCVPRYLGFSVLVGGAYVVASGRGH